jgi:hypothetical protein
MVKRHRFSLKEVNFIKKTALERSRPETFRLFNERFKTNLTYPQIRNKIRKLGITRKDRFYSPEEIEFIKENIAGRNYAEMENLFNSYFNRKIKVSGVAYLCWKHKISNGLRCLGAETKRPNGKVYIKVSDRKWKLKTHVIYEAANGPVPKGHCIIFADGDKSNFDLDNLLLVSVNEFTIMRNTGLIFPDKELTKTGKAIATLKSNISRHERRLTESRK